MPKKKKVEKVEEVEESKAEVGEVIPKFRGVPIDEILDSGDEDLIAAYKEVYGVE